MYLVAFFLVVFAAVREGIGVTVLNSYAPTGGSANGATTVNILGGKKLNLIKILKTVTLLSLIPLRRRYFTVRGRKLNVLTFRILL